jgi:hypothetical protein
MIKNLIALPYELARLPLVLVDKNLDNRLPEGSGPSVVLGRAVGTVDKVAGAVLHNRDLTKRGAERISRSDKLATAARLEEEASARRDQARETDTAGRQEAAQKRKDAQQRAASGLEEAAVAEARGKQEAKAKAAKAASKKKAAANTRAANRTAAAETRKERAESAAEAKQKAARNKAKTELNDARKTKQAADQARTDAERLSELVDAKKQQRKQN